MQLITREVFQYPEALIQMLARYTPTNTMLMFTWDIIITPTIHMSCLHFPRTWSLANMSCYCCQFQTILCTLEIDDQCRGHRIKQKDHPTGPSPPAETPPTHKAPAGAEPAICSHIRKHFQKTRNTAQTNKTIQDKTRQSSSGKSKNCYQSCERKKFPKKLIRTSQLRTPWLRSSY